MGAGVCASCAGTSLPGAVAARLEISVVTAGAVVRVNDEVLPAEAARHFDVVPGTWRVSVSADGYLTRRYESTVGAGDVWSVDVELWPTLDELDGSDEADARWLPATPDVEQPLR